MFGTTACTMVGIGGVRMNLFENMELVDPFEPLAVRMRPRSLDHFFGQEQVVGPGTFLRSMIEEDKVPSLLLYGPSGTGKTTLAKIISELTSCRFVMLNATNVGIGELRSTIEEAMRIRVSLQQRTILFLDEIHRFNKSQQDVLLPSVESGQITLIGATTENPFFEVNRPLLSRLRLLTLERLDATALVAILRRALIDEDYGLGKKSLIVTDDLLEDIGRFVDGDARMALNILEQVGAMVRTGGEITMEIVEKVLGRRVYRYDKKGNNHYDIISAFIKSMRGSDPDAVLYYLARMIEAGEDPVFIARRIVICAAEDVGLADPQALVVANAAAQAAHMVGLPEARIILSEAALYVALAPKSNSAYVGIDAAIQAVRHKEQGEVPKHLRDAHYGGAKQLGHGVGYRYAQDYSNGYVEQQYLPDALVDEKFYNPLERGLERDLVKDWEDRKR